MHELVARFEARCAEAHVPYQVVQCAGVPATEITLAAHGVDLVVIGSNAACAGRRPGLARRLRWLLRHVPRPILTIPESYPRQGMVLIAL